MRFSPRIVVIVVSAVALVAGLFLGLRPLSAPLTLVSPVVNELTVSCGVGFLPTVPPAGAGDLVPLEGQPGVSLPRSTYAEHCDDVVGWQPYAAWALTGIGVAGLAVTLSMGRAPASAGGQHRNRRRK